MRETRDAHFRLACKRFSHSGFTIVELMIAMVVALVASGAAYSVYAVQQRNFASQQSAQNMQQNLRSALIVIEREIRMAGYDPEDSGGFGLVDIRRYDLVKNNTPDVKGQPALYYTYDLDEDGSLSDGGRRINKEHARFLIGDVHGDGHICLTWDNGSGRRPIAENIQRMGLAYAVDADGDGHLDRWADGEHLIWAVDSDNDNMLDCNLDTNNDGVIDEGDDLNGDLRIDDADGGALDSHLPLDRIRSVRIWLMAVSARPMRDTRNHTVYVVGDRLIKPAQDGFKRMVLEGRVACRNL